MCSSLPIASFRLCRYQQRPCVSDCLPPGRGDARFLQQAGFARYAGQTQKRGYANRVTPLLFNGGAEQDRTVDLLNAIQALSQLSYSPIQEPSLYQMTGGVSTVFSRHFPLKRQISFLTRSSPSAILPHSAGVVKLVDALDSKSSARKGMPVRPRPPAPLNNLKQSNAAQKALRNQGLFFLSCLMLSNRIYFYPPKKRVDWWVD